jgi:hypothetical protein
LTGGVECGIEDDDSTVEDDFLVAMADDEWETGLFESLDAIDHADAYCEMYLCTSCSPPF